jgi:predicted transcriptional regulator
VRRDNRLKTTVSDGVAADVAEIADEADKSVAEVVRQAIREYTDHDRTARIEERIGRIEDKVDTLARGDTPGSDDADHTHTNSDGMCDTGGSGGARSVAAERTREIVRWIHENTNGEALKDKQVSKAIWTFAGDDPRTVRKYKDQVKGGIIRYCKPHPPFVGLERMTQGSSKTRDTRQALYDGDLTFAGLVDAYVKTYRQAFEAAASIVPELNGRVIITADHGECLECGQLFHGRNHVPHDHLVNVPWFEVQQ